MPQFHINFTIKFIYHNSAFISHNSLPCEHNGTCCSFNRRTATESTLCCKDSDTWVLQAVERTEDLAAVLSYKMLSVLETKDIPLRKMLNQLKKRLHCVQIQVY